MWLAFAVADCVLSECSDHSLRRFTRFQEDLPFKKVRTNRSRFPAIHCGPFYNTAVACGPLYQESASVIAFHLGDDSERRKVIDGIEWSRALCSVGFVSRVIVPILGEGPLHLFHRQIAVRVTHVDRPPEPVVAFKMSIPSTITEGDLG